MLGIMIGVGSVIVLVAVGTGSSKQVDDNIDRLGTNTITVSGAASSAAAAVPRTRAATPSCTLKDVDALQDPVRPRTSRRCHRSSPPRPPWTTRARRTSRRQLIGTTATYAAATNYEIASGTFLSDDDVDDHAKVIVLGATVVDELFAGIDPLGAIVKINGNRFTVVGTLKPKGSTGVQNGDDVAMMPVIDVQDIVSGRTAG